MTDETETETPEFNPGDEISTISLMAAVQAVLTRHVAGEPALMQLGVTAPCGHRYMFALALVSEDDTDCEHTPKRPKLTIVPTDGGLH